MVWERFQYLCRAGLAHTGDESLSDYIDNVNAKDSTDLYGKVPEGSLPMCLLKATKELEPSQARLALKTYAALNPSYLLDKPNATRRLPTYLLCVAVVYILAVSAYQTKIFPMFEEAMQGAILQIPPDTRFLIDYGPLVAIGLGLVILLLVAITFGLTRMVSLNKDYSKNRLVLNLCPGFLKTPYLNLLVLLRYPSDPENLDKKLAGEYQAHFEKVLQSGMELDQEIGALFKAEDQKLIRRIEIVSKVISVVIALIVFFTVYKFVYGFYLPFFYYGVAL